METIKHTRPGEKFSSFYTRASVVIMGLLATFYIIYIGRDILAPFLFSLLLSILLNPIINFLMRKGINQVVAILLTITVAIALLCCLLFFVGTQFAQFRDSLPELKKSFSDLFAKFTTWVSHTFNMKQAEVNEKIQDMGEKQMQNGSGGLGATVGNIAGFLVSFLLIPVYTFLLLYYKRLLLHFLHKAFPSSEQDTVAEVLSKVKVLIQSYLVGLMIEASIVAALDSIGLLLIGIEHAILFGVMAAFFNLIPYIGGIIATAMPTAIALTSDTPNDAFLVIGLFALVQLIDNNFLIPRIVGSKVKINALVSIFAVIVGGALWGVPGMFFAIPVTAIVKVICDAVDSMQPLGILLGDNMPPVGKAIFKFKPPKEEKA